ETKPATLNPAPTTVLVYGYPAGACSNHEVIPSQTPPRCFGCAGQGQSPSLTDARKSHVTSWQPHAGKRSQPVRLLLTRCEATSKCNAAARRGDWGQPASWLHQLRKAGRPGRV